MELFTPLQYLQMDIAAQHSCDKMDWDDRLQWTAQNEAVLEQLINTAEEPQLYLAAVTAYRDVQKGKAIGYPISLDATASGLQILSCLIGDKNGAAISNVTNTGHRRDAYTVIYRHMLALTGDDAKLTRKQTKDALMTSLYGSTAVPKRMFGHGSMLTAFYRTNETVIPHVWSLNQTFLAMWNPEIDNYGWVMPDNFHVSIDVEEKVVEEVHFRGRPTKVVTVQKGPSEDGRAYGANATHSVDAFIVREMGRRCDYDPAKIERVRQALATGSGVADSRKGRMLQTLLKLAKFSGFLSARVLDYIDETTVGHLQDRQSVSLLIDSMPAAPFKVLPNHDCFRVLPTYGNDVRLQYNVLLTHLAYSDMLNYICTQLTGRRTNFQKADTGFFKDIIDANYSLS